MSFSHQSASVTPFRVSLPSPPSSPVSYLRVGPFFHPFPLAQKPHPNLHYECKGLLRTGQGCVPCPSTDLRRRCPPGSRRRVSGSGARNRPPLRSPTTSTPNAPSTLNVRTTRTPTPPLPPVSSVSGTRDRRKEGLGSCGVRKQKARNRSDPRGRRVRTHPSRRETGCRRRVSSQRGGSFVRSLCP